MGRNPPPGSALIQGIDPQLPGGAKLPPLGMGLILGGVGQTGETTKDGCSGRDLGAGRRQKITGVKVIKDEQCCAKRPHGGSRGNGLGAH